MVRYLISRQRLQAAIMFPGHYVLTWLQIRKNIWPNGWRHTDGVRKATIKEPKLLLLNFEEATTIAFLDKFSDAEICMLPFSF